MLLVEVCSVLVQPVGQEHGNIVAPGVARCSAKQNPPVPLGDLQESLHPGAAAHYSLLVKYEEGVLHLLILADVVPAIHHHFVVIQVLLRMDGQQICAQLLLPLHGVPLPGGGNDVEVGRLLHLSVLDGSDDTAVHRVKICQAGAALATANPAAKDAAVLHPPHGLVLVGIEADPASVDGFHASPPKNIQGRFQSFLLAVEF